MQIARDPEVDDIVRWGARRRAGWSDEADEHEHEHERLAFLASLRDGDATLRLAIEQAAAWSPPDGEYPPGGAGLPGGAAAGAAAGGRAAGDRGRGGRPTWFLHALVHLPDPPVQRLAIEALARRRDRASVGALARAARTAGDEAVRREAQVAERRLRLHVVGPEATGGADEEDMALPPVDQVMASEIDGDGGQMLLVVRVYEGIDASLLAGVFWNDHWGVKDAWGMGRLPTEEAYEGLIEQMAEAMTLVEIDLPAARGLLDAAITVNAASGRPTPPVFELWAPPSSTTACRRSRRRSRDGAGAGRWPLCRPAGVAEAERRIAQYPLFRSWFFNPEELLPRLTLVPPPSRGRLTDRQYRPLIAGLIDDEARERLRGRLRRQARLLDRMGDVDDRDLALAAAAGLADQAKLSKHPLLRAMIDSSLFNLAGDFDEDEFV